MVFNKTPIIFLLTALIAIVLYFVLFKVENFNSVNKLEFIHIPKNAGTSIENLGNKYGIKWGRFKEKKDYQLSKNINCNYWHNPYFTKKEYTNYFAVLRNPYDKLISEFYYVNGENNDKYASYSHLQSFYLWLDDIYKTMKNNRYANDCHLLPQSEFIYDNNGSIKIDNIIYLDNNFKDNLNKLFKKHNIGIDINELKKDNSRNREFTKNDLNEKALNQINEMYSIDFEKLGFTKLQPRSVIENFTNKRDMDYYEDFNLKKKKKIALCFLIKDSFDNLDFYNYWLDGVSSDKYQIYIHWKNKPDKLFKNYKNPNIIETKWGDISLVKATLNMFDLAVKDNCDMMFLLSNDTLPLKSFDEIYKINNTEIVYFNENQLPHVEMTNYNKPIINKVLKVNHIFKQNMFFCIKKEDFIKINFRYFLNKFENLNIPDEWFFINLMNEHRIKLLTNSKYIYVNRVNGETQAMNFDNNSFNSNKENIMNYYFIRKIEDFRKIKYFKNKFDKQ